MQNKKLQKPLPQPQQPQTDEIIFEDEDSWGGKNDQYTFQQVVLKQLQKCLQEGSKEMTIGGKQQRIINGELLEVFVPNQRTIFINSCNMFRILLLGKIKDKDTIEKLKSFDDKIAELNTCADAEYNKIKDRYYTQSQSKQIDTIPEYNSDISDVSNTREVALVELYRTELLPALSMLLEELNWFEERGFNG